MEVHLQGSKYLNEARGVIESSRYKVEFAFELDRAFFQKLETQLEK